MSALDLLNKLPAAINPAAVAGVHKVIQFNITEPAYVEIKDGTCTVSQGQAAQADLTLQASDADLVDVLTGKLNGVTAVMTGKLKVQGDIGLAQQIGRYFDARQLS